LYFISFIIIVIISISCIGYQHSTILVVGSGVTQTMLNWGNYLLQRSGKPRFQPTQPRDVVAQYLGYHTDNGGISFSFSFSFSFLFTFLFWIK